MIITQPDVTLTDAAIALECAVFSTVLLRSPHGSQRWWAIAFGAVVVASLAGTIYHGIFFYLTPQAFARLQGIALYALGVASSSMVLGVAASAVPASLQRWFFLGVGIKLLIYGLHVMQYPHFSYGVVDYMTAMAIVLGLQFRAVQKRQTQSTRWLVAGILVSGVAVLPLKWQWHVGAIVEPDTIYHLIQILALYLFYRGVSHLQDYPQNPRTYSMNRIK